MKAAYHIRQELTRDHLIVRDLIEQAFRNVTISDHTEHQMVERLRQTDSFIPELSLVAEYNDQIVGHILFTKIHVVNKNHKHETLALAPVSVLPEHQKKGIGRGLITTGHDIARSLGFTSIILIGHEDYYPKFGYVPTTRFNITMPFPVPPANAMAIELTTSALSHIEGEVEYPKAFFQ